MKVTQSLFAAGRSSLRHILCVVVALVTSGLALSITSPGIDHAARTGCGGSGQFIARSPTLMVYLSNTLIICMIVSEPFPPRSYTITTPS